MAREIGEHLLAGRQPSVVVALAEHRLRAGLVARLGVKMKLPMVGSCGARRPWPAACAKRGSATVQPVMILAKLVTSAWL